MSPFGVHAFRHTKKPVGGATYVIYPSSTGQGDSSSVSSVSTVSYANARAGTGDSLTVVGPTVGQNYQPFDPDPESGGPEAWTCDQSFARFDTSVVVGTITSATLALNLGSDLSTTDFIIEARLRDWGNTLEAADFVPGADLGGLTLLATYNTSSGFSNGYNNLTDVAMVANINQAGFTRMVIASNRQRLNNTPTDTERVDFSYSPNPPLRLTVVTT